LMLSDESLSSLSYAVLSLQWALDFSLSEQLDFSHLRYHQAAR
jgi:hypothetical protein